MSAKLDENETILIDPPNPQRISPSLWAQAVAALLISLDQKKIAVFKHFPPELIDYYHALQIEIAKRKTDEQDRPYIVLHLRGKNAQVNERSPVGLAGGTGPLTDAEITSKIIKETSGLEQSDEIAPNREWIAQHNAKLSVVLYSMPPPRDAEHLLKNSRTFLRLYSGIRHDAPCDDLYILSNTAHAKKNAFHNRLLLGSQQYGKVDDLTKSLVKSYVLGGTKEPVLVLGTQVAAELQLYPREFKKQGIQAMTPTQRYENTPPNDYMQNIIDHIKEGDLNKPFSKGKSCGECLIDFIKHSLKDSSCKTLLFSCTELSIILHAKQPNSEQTYFERLKQELPGFTFLDSEAHFVQHISQKIESVNAAKAGSSFKERLDEVKKDGAIIDENAKQTTPTTT
jgi:aspartate/glutamate racemase